MSAQRITGTVAVISAAGLLVLAIVSSVAGSGWSGQAWTAGTGTTGTVMGPGMMGGAFGGSMMGGGFSPGMGGGMGPGMMGPGHMGYGYDAQGTTAPIADAPTVTITATDLRFSTAEITLASGETNLTLVNDGRLPHDLTVPALGIRVVAGPGQTTTVGLRDLPAGTYAGYCSVAGHADAGMRIAVVVE